MVASMTTKKKLLITGSIIITIFIGYKLYQFISLINSFDECGMSAGPIYGLKITAKLDSLNIKTYISIPDGQLAISNTTVDSNSVDTFPPILLKLDKKKNVIWAVSLNSKADNYDIPLYSMENIQLVNDKNGKRIEFFNESYMEPGIIYLKENYDFDYLCLSPM